MISGVGPALTLLGTFGGVWVVVLLFRWFQRDFAETYRKELVELRSRLEQAERDLDLERRGRQTAENEAAGYRYTLTLHGIPVPGKD